MKKLVLIFTVFAVSIMLGVQNVFAEEAVEVIAEPTAYENFIAAFGDFANLKNFVVTSGGLAALVALAKVRGAWKFFKTPKGILVIESIGMNILSKVTEKPDMVVKIMEIVVEFPVVKQILDNAKRKAELYEVELQGKILDIEAKLSAEVFEGTAQNEAVEYLTKLRDEYEIIKSNE